MRRTVTVAVTGLTFISAMMTEPVSGAVMTSINFFPLSRKNSTGFILVLVLL
jgi:hypothetical protein